MTWQRLTSGNQPNPFTVVHTTDEPYSASNKELVITEGGEVVLPEPTPNGIIAVRDFDQRPTLTPASGTIQGFDNRRLDVADTVFFVSDGADWYTISDRQNLTRVIPDSAVLRQPWDEGSGLTAQDVIGDNDGTLSEPDWITNSDFEGGVGLSFDGNGDSVQIDNLPYLMDDDVLASITVNFNNVDSNQIIANLAPTPLIDGAFAFGISRDTNGAFAFRDFRNGGSTDNSQSEDGVFSPNTNYRVSVLIPANTSGYRAWVNNQELSLPEGEDISLARDESHFGGGFSPETLDGTGDHPILYQAPTDIEDTVAKDYEAQVWS